MTNSSPEFIIYAPAFSEKSGGVIALHLLCERLNRLGFTAMLWPWKPRSLKWNNLASIRSHTGYYLRQRGYFYSRGPFQTRIARPSDISNAIVIYPEITSGNPLGASMVARWFLHRPGYHTGKITYGPNEIYFFYNEAFNDVSINSHGDLLLRMIYVNTTYQRTNCGARSGSCYLIYKGRRRALNRHPSDAILVDHLSHAEKAKIFNQAEIMYSYDLYTFYSIYAAICGCVPVIIPEDGVTKEEWEPNLQRRVGLAYGTSEIASAREEREELLRLLDNSRAAEDSMVIEFVKKCRLHFGVG